MGKSGEWLPRVRVSMQREDQLKDFEAGLCFFFFERFKEASVPGEK